MLVYFGFVFVLFKHCVTLPLPLPLSLPLPLPLPVPLLTLVFVVVLVVCAEKATDEELNKFFNENFYMIYGVFLDTFSAYEVNCKKGTCRLPDRPTDRPVRSNTDLRLTHLFIVVAGRHSTTEISEIQLILRNVLIHLAELIRRKWQTRSIGMTLVDTDAFVTRRCPSTVADTGYA
jgi:hypothetical protein